MPGATLQALQVACKATPTCHAFNWSPNLQLHNHGYLKKSSEGLYVSDGICLYMDSAQFTSSACQCLNTWTHFNAVQYGCIRTGWCIVSPSCMSYVGTSPGSDPPNQKYTFCTPGASPYQPGVLYSGRFPNISFAGTEYQGVDYGPPPPPDSGWGHNIVA